MCNFNLNRYFITLYSVFILNSSIADISLPNRPTIPTIPPVGINSDQINALKVIENYCQKFNTIQFRAGTKILKVPQEFAKISDAVKAANDGDTIFIKNGIYRENINTTKDMIFSNPDFKRLSLIGESRDGVIIDSPVKDELYGLRIGAGTVVRNLTITNTLNAIIAVSKNIDIANVKLKFNRNGIILSSDLGYSLEGASEIQCAVIENNNISAISVGGPIGSNNAFSSKIRYNILRKNGLYGLGIYKGTNTTEFNAIYFNGTKDNGTGLIISDNKSEIKILNNLISNHRNAATINKISDLTIRQNILSLSQYGLIVDNENLSDLQKLIISRNQIKEIEKIGSTIKAKEFTISNNLFYNTGASTLFTFGEKYSIYNNTFSGGEFGIRIQTDVANSEKLVVRFLNNILTNYTKTSLLFSCDSFGSSCKNDGVNYRFNLFWNNGLNTANLSDLMTANILSNPLLTNIDGKLAYPMAGSPVYNKGFNLLDSVDSLDIAGNPRIQNGYIDIGAYEINGYSRPLNR